MPLALALALAGVALRTIVKAEEAEGDRGDAEDEEAEEAEGVALIAGLDAVRLEEKGVAALFAKPCMEAS